MLRKTLAAVGHAVQVRAPASCLLLAWLGVVWCGVEWDGPCVHHLFSYPTPSLSTRHRSHPIPSLQSQSAKGGGFISDGKNFVTIKSLKILSPSDAGAAIATVNVDNE